MLKGRGVLVLLFSLPHLLRAVGAAASVLLLVGCAWCVYDDGYCPLTSLQVRAVLLAPLMVELVAQEFLTLLRLHAPAAPLPSADCTRRSIALQTVSGTGCGCAEQELALNGSAACAPVPNGRRPAAQEPMERAVEAILCEIGEDPSRPVWAQAWLIALLLVE